MYAAAISCLTAANFFCRQGKTAAAWFAAGFAAAVFVDTPGIRVPGVSYVPVEGTEPVSYGAAYMPGGITPLLRRFVQVLEERAKNT